MTKTKLIFMANNTLMLLVIGSTCITGWIIMDLIWYRYFRLYFFLFILIWTWFFFLIVHFRHLRQMNHDVQKNVTIRFRNVFKWYLFYFSIQFFLGFFPVSFILKIGKWNFFLTFLVCSGLFYEQKSWRYWPFTVAITFNKIATTTTTIWNNRNPWKYYCSFFCTGRKHHT